MLAGRIFLAASRDGTLRGGGSLRDGRVLRVSGGRILGALVAVAMVLFGGFLALAGLGYIGDSASTSGTWSVLGSLIAGFGIALMITLRQRR